MTRSRESSWRGWARTTAPGFVLFLATLPAQQRDHTTARIGTGEITGVVMSAGAVPQPVRRVVVSISGDVAEPLSVITDDSGRFTFSRLPTGNFTIGARKIAYIPAQFGAARPGGAGSAIALGAGEKRQVSITLHKGVVLAGTLRDPSGTPMGGVAVAAIDVRARPVNTITPAPESVVTDDRGMFRFYGLPASEYVVAAAPAAGGTGVIGSRSPAELDALFALLTDRQSRARAAGDPGPPAPAALPIGFAAIYFPGTPMFGEASRIRAAAGDEKAALNFTVTHVPVASIAGTVTGDTPNLTSVVLAIIPDAPRLSNMPGTLGITSTPPDADGAFTYGNLAPGRYRIVARARRSGGDPGGPPAANARAGMGAGAPPAGVKLEPVGDMVYAAADVDVRGQNVTGVSLVLQPAGFIAGRIVFDAEKAQIPDDFTEFRVQMQQVGGTGLASQGSTRVGNAITTVLPVNVKDDGTFLITGLGPTPYHVVVTPPAALASTWKVRSAMVDGRDLLDTNFDGTYAQIKDVRVTLSDKRTELSGLLQSASGQPVSEYYVVAFSTDRANWKAGSRRTASVRPATNGRFVLPDLPAGEYFIAAFTDLDPIDLADPEFLAQVAGAGVKVSLGEGEKKVQDLRIR